MHFGLVGPDAQRRLVERNSFRVFLLARQRIAQVVQRVVISRINLERLAVVLHRLGRPALTGQVKAEIIVRQVVVARHFHRVPEQRLAVAPELDLPHGQERAGGQH